MSTLEDIDFADDIAPLSTRQEDMQEKSQIFSHYASQIDLELNTKKTEEIRFNTSSENKLEIDGNDMKQVDKFVYLEAVESTEDPKQKDIKN